jgi:hypothetical protein
MEDHMITLQDCIGFIELDADTLHFVAARCRLPDIIAAQFAAQRRQMPAGATAIAPLIQHQHARSQ